MDMKKEPYAEMEITVSAKNGILNMKMETCGNGAGHIECIRKIVADVAKAMGQQDRRAQSMFEKHLLMALTMDSMERMVNDGGREN